jgi:hypothetical protein
VRHDRTPFTARKLLKCRHYGVAVLLLNRFFFRLDRLMKIQQAVRVAAFRGFASGEGGDEIARRDDGVRRSSILI